MADRDVSSSSSQLFSSSWIRKSEAVQWVDESEVYSALTVADSKQGSQHVDHPGGHQEYQDLIEIEEEVLQRRSSDETLTPVMEMEERLHGIFYANFERDTIECRQGVPLRLSDLLEKVI